MKLYVFPKAESQIRSAVEWYEEQRKGLGAEFSAAVRAKFSALERAPEGFAIQFENVRIALIDGFPYLIFFCISSDSVDVIGFLHAGRNPRLWKRL